MSQLTPQTTLVGLAGILALAGLGSALFESANNSAIMGSAAADRLSAAGASIAAGRQMAHSIGFALAGAIFAIRDQHYLDELISPETSVINSFGDVMLIAGIICYLGVALAYLRGGKET